MLTLTFFNNSKGAAVADLHAGERRLLATTHPATIVAAMFAMDRTRLKVVTGVGSHTAGVLQPKTDGLWGKPVQAKMLFDLAVKDYQWSHLAESDEQKIVLDGLDYFAFEDWAAPTEVADEYIRIAHHHLPKELIKRPLAKAVPAGWKKTLKKRNQFIYFPYC